MRAVQRTWLSPTAQTRETDILNGLADLDLNGLDAAIHDLTDENRRIHEVDCINLNPATNIMNPRAEALLAAGLGSRPSLGHAGEKYEMGLEAIEQIEVIAADVACRVFDADHAEVRVASGALANLYAFMATCQPGDAVIVSPASIGGHVTHNTAGAAGLYGLEIHEAPIDPVTYTIDVEATRALAEQVNPRLITVGASLNLSPHPVSELVDVARSVDARVLFDAAHLCGMIASRQWANPLAQGADLMTMSTYKSLGGPAGGLLVTSDADLAERVDAIAFPGLTANFDVAKTAALTITLLDWLEHGEAYGAAMVENAAALAASISANGVDLFEVPGGVTSHQFAIDARPFGGGNASAVHLRDANLLTCAIGLPSGGDDGLRIGTPEVTRIGMASEDMAELGAHIAFGLLGNPADVAGAVSALRGRFDSFRYMREI